MAILIPSKNIYDKQNPKVRDNVIERIEVGAVEVVPDNEYETPVYNENIKSPKFNEEKKHNSKYEKYTYLEEDSAAEYEDYIGIYAGITAKYTNIDISIPKLLNNKLISNLLLKKDNESIIGINLVCEVRYYSVTADYDVATNTISNIKRTENEQKKETKNGVNIQEIFSKQNGEKGYLYFSKSENKYGVYGGTVSIETNIKDNNNILSTSYNDENKSYEIKGLKILSGATGLGLSGHSGDYDYIPLTGDEVDYTPIQVELTVYGNTIGIDLIDKTVYIPETDKTSKKVFSVEGNELMQTSNYYQSTDTNAIKRAFTNTLSEYSKGKETATIRCSISDYYNEYGKAISISKKSRNLLPKEYAFGAIKTINGVTATALAHGGVRLQGTNTGDGIFFDLMEKDLGCEDIISEVGKTTATNGNYTVSIFGEGISNVTIGYNKHNNRTWLSIFAGETVDAIVYPMVNEGGFIQYEEQEPTMSFKMYDQVIPMVYGADGQDRPMSLYKDGSAKVFQVLGTNIYYDGAVWQELSLQELDKAKIL